MNGQWLLEPLPFLPSNSRARPGTRSSPAVFALVLSALTVASFYHCARLAFGADASLASAQKLSRFATSSYSELLAFSPGKPCRSGESQGTCDAHSSAPVAAAGPGITTTFFRIDSNL
eukprot:6197812-Pleurochrysis_carterae.AAC.1